jgi:hypothetical protein
MNENLRKAISLMLFMSDQQILDEDIDKTVKKANWFQKYTWTERQEEKYREWFIDFIKKDWKGIVERKPTSKKHKEKIADEFLLNYGLKTRPLKPTDFTPLVPPGQLEETMSKNELERFYKWMFGQTQSLHGVYRWDLERFLNNKQDLYPN